MTHTSVLRKSPLRKRESRGIALFAALALMAVIALLVAGAAASTSLSQRSARYARVDVELTNAADYALASVLADSRTLSFADLPLGKPSMIDTPIPGDHDIQVRVAVTRLAFGVLWLVADASNGGTDRGHRRVNLVARFHSVGKPPAAGVVAQGDVEIGANVTFPSDTSTDPECASSAGSSIVVGPGAVVHGLDSALVVSSPVAADSAAYYLTAAQQTALRDGGQLVHTTGDTTITGGAFDGILIVDGALTISGPFAASGLIVARGPITAVGAPFSMVGAVMSFAGKNSFTPAIKFSGVTIRYSLCAIDRALRRAIIPRPVSQRSWAELF